MPPYYISSKEKESYLLSHLEEFHLTQTQEEHIDTFAYCKETTAQIQKEVAVNKGRRESKGEHLPVPAWWFSPMTAELSKKEEQLFNSQDAQMEGIYLWRVYISWRDVRSTTFAFTKWLESTPATLIQYTWGVWINTFTWRKEVLDVLVIQTNTCCSCTSYSFGQLIEETHDQNGEISKRNFCHMSNKQEDEVWSEWQLWRRKIQGTWSHHIQAKEST